MKTFATMTPLEVFEHVKAAQAADPVLDLWWFVFVPPISAPPRLCPPGTPPEARIIWPHRARRAA